MAFDNLGPSDEFDSDWDNMDFGDSDESSDELGGIPGDDGIDFGTDDMDSIPRGNPSNPMIDQEIDIDGDFELGGTTESTGGGPQDSGKKGIMKTALIAIAVGSVILLVAIFIFARIGKAPHEPKVTPAPQISQQVDNSNPKVDNPPAQTSYNNWVEFKSEYDTDFSTVISSTFTVTNIRNFANVVNESNDKIVKSVITGNISGLIGTYEAEIPYDIGRNITIGTTVKCEYSLYAQDGVKIIGEIRFP